MREKSPNNPLLSPSLSAHLCVNTAFPLPLSPHLLFPIADPVSWIYPVGQAEGRDNGTGKRKG